MTPFTLNIRGTLRHYNRPAVMAIVNVTPDSFYDGSRYTNDDELAERINAIVMAGADFIDIGAASSRPGAPDVGVDSELSRLEPAMKILRAIAPDAVVSVDTYHAEVARIAVTEFGCDMVNDISGTNIDPAMASTVSALNVPYILTHSRGTPRDMNEFTDYENVTADVLSELGDRLQWLALEGVNDIIVDPGIGFSKTLEQNYQLIHDLSTFRLLHRPILMGVSRKSLITRLLGVNTSEALNATTALNTLCLDRGADILRVHDVEAAREAVTIYCAVNQPETIDNITI